MGNNSSTPSNPSAAGQPQPQPQPHRAHSHSHSHSHSKSQAQTRPQARPQPHSRSQSHSHSSPRTQSAGVSSTPHSQTSDQARGQTHAAQQQSRQTQHTNRSSLHSSSGAITSTASESSSYDHTLTPATSLSPSLTRVEAHHHTHRHGSSLDSYLVDQPVPPSKALMGAASSSEKLPKPRPHNRDRTESGSPRSIPVSVPSRQKSLRQREGTPQPDTPPFRPSAPPRDNDASSYAPPQSVYPHPPRLPLPIEQEELTPGSPVLTATDFNHGVADLEGEDELGDDALTPSKSLLSHTTADDEEESVGDPAEQDQVGADANRRTVPVEVTWIEPGEKIYVTGTFANWSKKYRMRRDTEGGPAKATLDLLPGMHHIRYIVDSEMRLREDNDQAVDYTNTLVNIIEVPAEPVFHQPTQEEHDAAVGQEALKRKPPSLHPPLVVPPRAAAQDQQPRAESPKPPSRDGKSTTGPELMEVSPAHYGQQVPSYLLDLDRDERTARFQRASSRVADIAPPPSLPGFLSKSILNGTMPMKDDSSVLNMPNHTVLNHLATSSIRQGVLATSLTTRYKRKYVTLITYRPTTLDD